MQKHIEDIHTVEVNEEAGPSSEETESKAAQSTNIANEAFNRKEEDIVLNTGTKSKVYTCDICGSTFGRRGHLEKHTETEHNGPHVAIKNLCDVCLVSFENKAELKQHTMKHSPNLKNFNPF